jgi:hypothetical protein
MRRSALLILVLAGSALGARAVQAQIGIAPQAVWGSDSDLGVGARLVVSAGGAAALHVEGLLSFDWYLDCNDCNYYEITPGAAVAISLLGIGPYAGAGVNIARLSPDTGDADTEIGLSLFVGARLPFGLFAEIRNTAGGSDQRVITVGFRLGG